MRVKELRQQYAVAQESLVPSARLIQVAKPDPLPVKPHKSLNLLLGIAGGLLLGLSLALLAELVDDTFHSPQEIERALGSPVLGVVPYAREVGDLSRWESGGSRDVSIEAFRTIRSSISFVTVETELRTLLVTSAGLADGKTTIAANLAAAFAEAGKRVLLIDADLRRPKVHDLFDVANVEGLTGLLLGGGDLGNVVVGPVIEHLCLLTSGPLPPDPVRLLDSSPMRDTLERARGQYDMIILDSPPAGVVADPQVLAAQADGVILVVEPGKSNREAVANAKVLLERSHAQVLGVVANRVKRASSGYYNTDYHGDGG